MHEKIINYLKLLEEEYDIKILLACETGSRAWGFPSPNSDYDIRLIYVHKKDWYLSLTEGKDTIDVMLENNDIDISGWDLRKALRLLKKSNPPLLERIQSPIIYISNQNFLDEINQISMNFYSKIATIYHYLNMSKNMFSEIENKSEYKLKKFFYALRTSTTCKWILEKSEIPPIEFKRILDGLDINKNLLLDIERLTTLKSQKDETYLHSGEKELFSFISENIKNAEEKSNSLPSAKFDSETLNIFFRKTLEDVWK